MKNYFLFISIMLFLLISLNACKKEGINLNFQKKEKLKITAEIVAKTSWNTLRNNISLSIFNASKQGKFHVFFKTHDSSKYSHTSFVVNSKKKSIFFNNSNTIFQINSSDNTVVNKLHIPKSFQGEKRVYEFDKLIAASDSKVWFTVSFPNQKDDFIYFWKYGELSSECKKSVYKYDSGNIVITSQNNTVTGWFFLKENNPIKIPTDLLKGGVLDFNSVDYSEEKGWLFSANHPEPDYDNIKFITYINPKNEVIKLCKGGLAVFGNDNFVYFIRKQGTIWRISLKTKKEELVFTPSNLFVPGRNLDINFSLPLFNQGKTLMMFPYEQKGQERQDWPFAVVIVIFDFLNKEYLILDNQLDPTSSLRYQDPKWINICTE